MSTKARQQRQAIARHERIAVAAQLWRQENAQRSESFIDGLESAAKWHDQQAAKAQGLFEANPERMAKLEAIAMDHRMYAAQIRKLKSAAS